MGIRRVAEVEACVNEFVRSGVNQGCLGVIRPIQAEALLKLALRTTTSPQDIEQAYLCEIAVDGIRLRDDRAVLERQSRKFTEWCFIGVLFVLGPGVFRTLANAEPFNAVAFVCVLFAGDGENEARSVEHCH